MNYTLQVGQITTHIPYLLGGAVVTVQLTFCAFIGGWLLGLLVALGIRSGPKPLAVVLEGYRSFFTNTPQLVKIFAIFFGLGELGIFIDPFWSAVLGLMLAESAYIAEIFRAGLQSVRQAELDAAETIGLSRFQILRFVTLPHLVKELFPPLSSQFILCLLYTSLASLVGVEELTGRALNIDSRTFRSLEIFVVVGIIYALLTVVATIILYGIGRYVFGIRARVF
jgi:polar amino acid transport system permease protein